MSNWRKEHEIFHSVTWNIMNFCLDWFTEFIEDRLLEELFGNACEFKLPFSLDIGKLEVSDQV